VTRACRVSAFGNALEAMAYVRLQFQVEPTATNWPPTGKADDVEIAFTLRDGKEVAVDMFRYRTNCDRCAKWANAQGPNHYD
jgi:hypothetical protein